MRTYGYGSAIKKLHNNFTLHVTPTVQFDPSLAPNQNITGFKNTRVFALRIWNNLADKDVGQDVVSTYGQLLGYERFRIKKIVYTVRYNACSWIGNNTPPSYIGTAEIATHSHDSMYFGFNTQTLIDSCAAYELLPGTLRIDSHQSQGITSHLSIDPNYPLDKQRLFLNLKLDPSSSSTSVNSYGYAPIWVYLDRKADLYNDMKALWTTQNHVSGPIKQIGRQLKPGSKVTYKYIFPKDSHKYFTAAELNNFLNKANQFPSTYIQQYKSSNVQVYGSDLYMYIEGIEKAGVNIPPLIPADKVQDQVLFPTPMGQLVVDIDISIECIGAEYRQNATGN